MPAQGTNPIGHGGSQGIRDALVVHALLFVALVAVLLFFAPRFYWASDCMLVGGDGYPLPESSYFALRLSGIVRSYLLLVVPLALALFVLDARVYGYLHRCRGPLAASLWSWCLSAVLLATLMAVVHGLSMVSARAGERFAPEQQARLGAKPNQPIAPDLHSPGW